MNRSLADYDADGKLSKHEFSIAAHLIKRKLEGHELPACLPASLRADPAAPTQSTATLPHAHPAPVTPVQQPAHSAPVPLVPSAPTAPAPPVTSGSLRLHFIP